MAHSEGFTTLEPAPAPSRRIPMRHKQHPLCKLMTTKGPSSNSAILACMYIRTLGFLVEPMSRHRLD